MVTNTTSWLQPSYERVLKQLDCVLSLFALMEEMHDLCPEGKNAHKSIKTLCPVVRTSTMISVLAHQNPHWCPPELFGKDAPRKKENNSIH